MGTTATLVRRWAYRCAGIPRRRTVYYGDVERRQNDDCAPFLVLVVRDMGLAVVGEKALFGNVGADEVQVAFRAVLGVRA